MSDTAPNHEEHAHEHYIVPLWKYGVVITLLFGLMILTVVASFVDFGAAGGTIVALAIASAKATLIVMIFMNVFYSTRLTKIFVLGGFFWLVFLFGLIIIDFLSREMVTKPLPWE